MFKGSHFCQKLVDDRFNILLRQCCAFAELVRLQFYSFELLLGRQSFKSLLLFSVESRIALPQVYGILVEPT